MPIFSYQSFNATTKATQPIKQGLPTVTAQGYTKETHEKWVESYPDQARMLVYPTLPDESSFADGHAKRVLGPPRLVATVPTEDVFVKKGEPGGVSAADFLLMMQRRRYRIDKR